MSKAGLCGFSAGERGKSDFVVDLPLDKKEFKILQLTDIQTIDLSQTEKGTLRRSQLENAFYGDGVYDEEKRVWRYVRALADIAKPDMIIITGDCVYGETDDNGSVWRRMINEMNSLNVPWSFCFGNHDNESMKGVLWQAETAARDEYCVFAQGNVTGNSNFNILVKRGVRTLYNIYILDTNGCREIANPGEGLDVDNPDYDRIAKDEGIYPDQLEWFYSTASEVNKAAAEKTPLLAFFHIPILAFHDSLVERYGWDGRGELNACIDGDFGAARCDIRRDCVDRDYSFFNAAASQNCIGMFAGHFHCSYSSVMWRGIRLTYGLKTGTDAFYEKTPFGGTLITLDLDETGLKTEHIYQNN